MRLPAGHFRHEDVEQRPRRVLLAAYAWIARRASHDPSLLPAPLVLQDRALPPPQPTAREEPAGTVVRDRVTLPGPARLVVGGRERGRAASRPHLAPRPPWAQIGSP